MGYLDSAYNLGTSATSWAYDKAITTSKQVASSSIDITEKVASTAKNTAKTATSTVLPNAQQIQKDVETIALDPIKRTTSDVVSSLSSFVREGKDTLSTLKSATTTAIETGKETFGETLLPQAEETTVPTLPPSVAIGLSKVHHAEAMGKTQVAIAQAHHAEAMGKTQITVALAKAHQTQAVALVNKALPQKQ